MARIEADFRAVGDAVSRDPRAALKALKKFEAKYPPLADFPLAVKVKLSLLPRHGDPDEARVYAEALVAKAIKRNDLQVLEMASASLRRGDGKDSKKLLAVAVTAADYQHRKGSTQVRC